MRETVAKLQSRKVYALARVAAYIDQSERRILMNTFFNPQFSYCPLVWMFHKRTTNRKTNRFHGRSLRIIYNN